MLDSKTLKAYSSLMEKKTTKRFTLDIPVELHQDFKRLSVDEGKTMREMILEDIEKRVREKQKEKA